MPSNLRSEIENLLLKGRQEALTDKEIADKILSLVASKMPEKSLETRGNTQNPNNPMYSTKFAKGWNAYHDSVKSILNGTKIDGETGEKQ